MSCRTEKMVRLLGVWLLLVPLCSAKTPIRAGALAKYYINWDGGMKPCEGADNSRFDLTKLVVEKKSKTVMALVGDVKMTKETSKQLKFKLTLHKEVSPGNYEYLMTVEEDNLCKHLADDQKPWTPFIKEMGITGCPVPAKKYTFKSSSLDAAGFPMNAGEVGHYKAQVEMFDPVERAVCFVAEADVEPF